MRRISLADIDVLSAQFSPTRIDVFFFDSEESVFDDTLSDAERSRCARFATPLLRDRFRTCHAGKRAILSRYLRRAPSEVAFVTGRYDKPSLADKAIAFNLSHSASWVAMAIAADDIGVDCERIDITVDYQSLLPTVAHPQERIDGHQAFYRTWTRKEAVMKQLGLGFQLAPARVRVPDANAPLHAWQGTHIDDAGAAERAPLLVDVQAPPGYCAALASDTPCDVRVFTLLAGHTNQEGCT